MKKRVLSLLCVVVLAASCLTGCGVTKVSLDMDDINEYLEDADISDDILLEYEETNGVNYLANINNKAKTKTMSTWVSVSGYCELKGKYDGVWLYGFGNEDCYLLGSSETDKEGLYKLMDGYKAQFKK